MKSHSKADLPEVLFIVLHESGNLIYAYPPIGSLSYSVSSLVSAIFSLGEELSGDVEDVVRTNMGNKVLTFVKRDEVIYSLFTSKKVTGNLEALLTTLIDVVEESFPAEIIDGVVHTKNDTTQLTECIKATYKTYLVPKDPWECGSPNGGGPSLSEFYQRVEPEKIVKMFRALLADKNIVLVDYDEMLASKLVSNIDEIWPEQVELAPGSEIDSSIRKEQKTIFTAGKGMESCLEEKTDNVMFVYSDRSMQGSLKGDRLLESVNEHFENGSKKSINTILEDEITSLTAIKNDLEKLVSNADGDVSLKHLKKQLSKTYSPDTVTYELEVLAAENSPLLTKVKSSENPLEDLFLSGN